MNDQIKTQLSAFVDGELSDAESELLIRRISRDPALREQIAEYQALGRIMRNEFSVRIDGLLDRVKSELDSAERPTTEPAARRRSFKPLAGIATAAAVALVAIVGAGQFVSAPATTVEQYTVPGPDQLDYLQRHGETVNDFNTRVVTLQLREETLDADDEEETDEEATTEQ